MEVALSFGAVQLLDIFIIFSLFKYLIRLCRFMFFVLSIDVVRL